jgi:hypothetical protein
MDHLVAHDHPAVLEAILEALDRLGLALAEVGHVWTPRERELYERAVRSLNVLGKAD